MNKTRLAAGLILTLAGLVIMPQPAEAVVAASFACAIGITNDSTNRFLSWNDQNTNGGAQQFTVGSDGSLYTAWNAWSTTDTSRDERVAKFGTNCSPVWRHDVEGTAALGVDHHKFSTTPVFDKSGHLATIQYEMSNPPPATTSAEYRHLSSNTGLTLGGIADVSLPPNEPKLIGPDVMKNPSAADTYITSAKVYAAYVSPCFISGASCTATAGETAASKLKVYSDTGFEWSMNSPGKPLVNILTNSNPNAPTAYLTGGAYPGGSCITRDYYKVDLLTHAQIGSTITGGDCTNGGTVTCDNGGPTLHKAQFRPGYFTMSSKLFMVECNSNSLRWRQFDEPTWLIDSTTTITGLPTGDFHPGSFDVDGDNNLLICGFTEDDGHVVVGYVPTSTGVWQTLVDKVPESGGVSTIGLVFNAYCRFDFTGNFWLGYSPGCTGSGASGTANCITIEKWVITGTTIPPPPPVTTTYINPDAPSLTTTATLNPFDQAKNIFSEGWGISPDITNWLFSIAAIGMVTIAFARISGSPLLIGIGALLGVGLTIALGWLPLWVLFVLIFLIIAIASHNLFEAGRDEGESD